MGIERLIEAVLFRSRFLLIPFYFALLLGVVIAMVKGGQELWHTIPHVFDVSEEAIVLSLLKLVDLTLLANLLVMIGLASYENFVSQLMPDETPDRPKWLSQVGFSSMKLKMLGSIVAISAIHLLASFLEADTLADHTMLWQVIIHLAIAGSGVLLAVTDYLLHKSGH